MINVPGNEPQAGTSGVKVVNQDERVVVSGIPTTQGNDITESI